jgi:hypothetical protein
MMSMRFSLDRVLIMSRFPLHFWLGGFALLTVLLAGAAIGRLSGLSAGEGAYLTLLLLALLGWLVGRRGRRVRT